MKGYILVFSFFFFIQAGYAIESVMFCFVIGNKMHLHNGVMNLNYI